MIFATSVVIRTRLLQQTELATPASVPFSSLGSSERAAQGNGHCCRGLVTAAPPCIVGSPPPSLLPAHTKTCCKKESVCCACAGRML